jgi:hypothetical protein
MARTLRRGRRLARRTLNDRRQRFSRSAGAGGILQIAGVERSQVALRTPRPWASRSSRGGPPSVPGWPGRHSGCRDRDDLSDAPRGDRRRRPSLVASISLGVYRLWRDAGNAVGAVLAGVLADLFGASAAVWTSLRSPPRPDSSSPSACTKPIGRPRSMSTQPAPFEALAV